MMSSVDRDRRFMKLALIEARKGLGRTSPNPVVGAVVVRDDQVVAKGYHRRAGAPHAEAEALSKAGAAARGGTVYVTLEPCNHHGRTPPCTEKIIECGIRRVVVGMRDPNPLVAGGGNDYLAGRGIEVVSGVLEEDCLALNKPFLKHVQTGLPWVTMKAGVSIDGRIAARTGHSQWISGESARRRVHRLRDMYDAILVGSGTVLADNPSLTTRLPFGKGRDPLRVVLDSNLRTPPDAVLLTQKSDARTWIFCRDGADAGKKKCLEAAGAVVRQVKTDGDGFLALPDILLELGRQNVNSLLVEGGGRVHASFLKQRLYDQACLFVAPLFIGSEGLPVVGALGLDTVDQGVRFTTTRVRRLGEDVMIEGLF
ncbi:MAG: bifunctional diaminohydroxyphosphoribosylaminopyrimidine deaminase/5-amino-6-(5-phosphoribosylamino)uracil reductase RibD [Proteobacteria bacterium]|nr:bifunctional diaminohydroxyphosphoribosylaminopyrimidine deaminase/5-amino-6-(5-phosphoribosylamino)uracil reductase RibD [Pseudomonadota bacterium]MBU1736754.1 bifunctional diaminohydroxyphosphoribosylaminopyrimidine deaminase/5-amino-6-(5-phosphoribosylamino)uracil reductase RibD [Pseudomonadota bacterium]